jgi:hypothetical protein
VKQQMLFLTTRELRWLDNRAARIVFDRSDHPALRVEINYFSDAGEPSIVAATNLLDAVRLAMNSESKGAIV